MVTYLSRIISNCPVDDNLDLSVCQVPIWYVFRLCLRRRRRHQPERSDTDAQSQDTPGHVIWVDSEHPEKNLLDHKHPSPSRLASYSSHLE